MEHFADEEHAKKTFERLGHILDGEVEFVSSGLYCGPSTMLLRCKKCNWYFSYDQWTGDIMGDDTKVSSLICQK